MKLWIIGSKGMLASTLAALCDKQKIEFISSSHEEADITRLDRLKHFSHSKAASGVTHLVNCAAFTGVDEAEKDPERAHQINAVGPENVGTLATEMGAHVLHVSTDYVFGGDRKEPYVETDACGPINIYGKTKWEGEQNLLDACPQACIVRSSWFFGRGGKNFISSMLARMQKEPQITAVLDQKSRPTLVSDLAEAILSLLCHSGIFHFANEGESSRFEMAQAIYKQAAALNIPLLCREIIPAAAASFSLPAKRPAYSVLSTKKITDVLGRPPRHWESGLKELLSHAL